MSSADTFNPECYKVSVVTDKKWILKVYLKIFLKKNVQMRKLIRIFTVRLKTLWILGNPQNTLQWVYSDCVVAQAVWMRRLIGVSVGAHATV